MNWFNNIRIRNKLLIVFGILVCSVISFAVFTVVEITNISNNTNELINSYQARQIHIADAVVDAYRIRYANLSKGYLLEADNAANMVYRMLDDYEKSIVSFMENLIGFRDNIASDPKLSESEKQQRIAIVGGIEDSFAKYVKIANNIMLAVERMDKHDVIRTFEEAIPVGDDLNYKLQNLRDSVFFTAKKKVLEITDNTAHTINLVIAITVALIFISAFALMFVTNNINQPILKLEKATVEIADGNLAYPVRSERRDELGLLSNRISDMVDKISEHSKTMAIMDNMDSMICVSDLDYNLLYANKRLKEGFNLDEKKITGQKCYKTTRGKGKPCDFCQLTELLSLKDIFPTKDFEYVWDDVLNVWLGGTASIIRWVDGSMVLFQASRDVTQKKLQDELLLEALEAAKTASVAKSSFLANMSHEMRTPMNAILGIAEIQLQDDTHNHKTREAIEKIYNSGALLLNIINDILDLSKIEAGKLELAHAEYKVASLINDTVTLNMMRIGSKPIKFELSVDENTPSSLFGDDLRIKQILNNLLSNAIKYTKEGFIKLSVSFEKEKEGVTLVFSVSDTGQGMTEEQVSKLFEEYSRFNMEANRTTEGTGLGMSITQNLVRLMNGDISVKSELNWGTVFTIHLPQGSIGSGVLGKELKENLEKFQINGSKHIKRAQVIFEPMPYGRVLVVDDVESNLYVAKGLMSPYGLTIETVTSGFEAIDKIKSGNVYDIVFMDHMMPEMDGIETTKNMRDMGYTQTIVALTANAVVGQSDIFLANGFNGFIAKPIDMRQLNAILKKFIRDKQPPEVIEAAFQQKAVQEEHSAKEPILPPVDAKLAEIFARDASKAITTLEAIYKKCDPYEDEDLRLYTINVHAMKSALANVGESELSSVAYKLEQAGREKDIAAISAETPVFLGKLRIIIEKLMPLTQDSAISETANENHEYLREKLFEIKKSCEMYERKTAKNTIAELRQKAWPHQIKELLGTMDEHLLNGDFDEVSRTAEKIIETV